MKKNISQQNGFTLIELMVSIAIFTVVVVSVIGSVYTANASARKVQATENVLNNANFALESIVRNVRTGTIIGCNDTDIVQALPVDSYYGNDNCANGLSYAQSITIHSSLGRDSYIKYTWDSNLNGITKMEVPVTGGVIGSSWSDPISVTAPSVVVSSLGFNFVGITDPTRQRGVGIVFSGYASTDTDQTPFTIQTFVSQRNFQ
ncbi:MAG: type II secretion system protein [bacterium]